jgi:hypothetical protein
MIPPASVYSHLPVLLDLFMLAGGMHEFALPLTLRGS